MNLQLFRTIFGKNDTTIVATKLKREVIDFYLAKLDFEKQCFKIQYYLEKCLNPVHKPEPRDLSLQTRTLD